MDLLSLLSELDLPPRPAHIFPDSCPSIRDLDAVPITHDVQGDEFLKHCADPCPVCGAWNMCIGDYIYLGCCYSCAGGDDAFF
jgi:hypothetical protein